MSAPTLDLLTTEEVAEILRVPPQTVRRWYQQSKGPKGARVGKRILYNRKDVETWWQNRLRFG